jgi:23S rRNA (uracil1939-C5)-methyltransferase
MNKPPACPERCPACAHRHLSAAESLAQKRGWLARRLQPWAASLAPIRSVNEAQRWGYRDRVSLSAARLDGRWQFGMMRRDEFIPIPDCPIHSERVRASAALLSRHLPLAEGFRLAFLVQSGAQTVLVLKQREKPDTGWFTPALAKALAAIGVEGVWLHCFPAVGRKLFAKNGWHLLWGTERSRDSEGFCYGPGAFSQLLPELHAASLDEAAAFLAPTPGDRVVDLYCGRGLSLARWHAAGAQALGVELGAEAVACARHNVPDVPVLRGGCAQRLPQLAQWWQQTSPGNRLAYLNPPRTGLVEPVVRWLGEQARPRRLAYLSCSAGTLARDLAQLGDAGYRVERLTPYDFFPQTYHVETLALLSR